MSRTRGAFPPPHVGGYYCNGLLTIGGISTVGPYRHLTGAMKVQLLTIPWAADLPGRRPWTKGPTVLRSPQDLRHSVAVGELFALTLTLSLGERGQQLGPFI